MTSNYIVHYLFKNISKKWPDNIAVITNEKQITYRELDEYSDSLALYLSSLNIGPGDIVGLYLNKSIEMMVCLIGIMKSGASYLPLDPSFPQERLSYMIGHAQAKLVIYDQSDCPLPIKPEIPILDLTVFNWEKVKGYHAPEINDSELCYVIYTSGSTGRPKGVMLSHRTVVKYLEWMKTVIPLSMNDVVLAQTTFSFDVSVWEMFYPLLVGASCALVGDDVKYDPQLLCEFINRHQVNVAQFVPTALKTIADSNVLEHCPSLVHLAAGGEALHQSLVDQLSLQTNAKLHNFYGPTEATIYCCYHAPVSSCPYTIVPIGKPIPHARTYLFDGEFKLAEPGLEGELYLGGDILALGYIAAPELTAERFIDNPFIPDEKIYQTGDRVRVDSSGVLEYLGRMDRQVKISGYRIELNEIESQLSRIKEIANAAVVYQHDIDGQSSALTAYYLLKDGLSVDPHTIKEKLMHQLPYYMCPSKYIEIDDIATLPNGKTDYSRLSQFIKNKVKDMSEQVSKKANKVEGEIIEIWKEVLKKDALSVKDNFFDAGGNSLLMSKVHRQIKAKLDIPISIMDLFQYPTVKALSKSIQEKYLTTAK
ncbi:MAG: Plipastatin synthase subunit A [Candidatus Celerinatantimonas neptuna]|nr:MAG: Plipastatin synthase subunit A [Candidatus Celerinatantimonas neptuna]